LFSASRVLVVTVGGSPRRREAEEPDPSAVSLTTVPKRLSSGPHHVGGPLALGRLTADYQQRPTELLDY
jgi:hypothetical protein